MTAYLSFTTQQLYNHSFLVILLNAYIYIFTLLFFFLLLFSMNLKFLKTLNNLKILTQTSFFINSCVFLFLSLAGLPPFLGFVGKFILMIFLFKKTSFLFLILFFIFNCFSIYFYIQHLKFLIVKTKDNGVTNILFDLNVFFILNVFFFFFVFGIFIFQTLLILLTPLCFF